MREMRKKRGNGDKSRKGNGRKGKKVKGEEGKGERMTGEWEKGRERRAGKGWGEGTVKLTYLHRLHLPPVFLPLCSPLHFCLPLLWLMWSPGTTNHDHCLPPSWLQLEYMYIYTTTHVNFSTAETNIIMYMHSSSQNKVNSEYSHHVQYVFKSGND